MKFKTLSVVCRLRIGKQQTMWHIVCEIFSSLLTLTKRRSEAIRFAESLIFQFRFNAARRQKKNPSPKEIHSKWECECERIECRQREFAICFISIQFSMCFFARFPIFFFAVAFVVAELKLPWQTANPLAIASLIQFSCEEATFFNFPIFQFVKPFSMLLGKHTHTHGGARVPKQLFCFSLIELVSAQEFFPNPYEPWICTSLYVYRTRDDAPSSNKKFRHYWYRR